MLSVRQWETVREYCVRAVSLCFQVVCAAMYSVMIMAPFPVTSAGALGPDAPPPRQPSVLSSAGKRAHGSSVDEADNAVVVLPGGGGFGVASGTLGRPDGRGIP